MIDFRKLGLTALIILPVVTIGLLTLSSSDSNSYCGALYTLQKDILLVDQSSEEIEHSIREFYSTPEHRSGAYIGHDGRGYFSSFFPLDGGREILEDGDASRIAQYGDPRVYTLKTIDRLINKRFVNENDCRKDYYLSAQMPYTNSTILYGNFDLGFYFYDRSVNNRVAYWFFLGVIDGEIAILTSVERTNKSE